MSLQKRVTRQPPALSSHRPVLRFALRSPWMVSVQTAGIVPLPRHLADILNPVFPTHHEPRHIIYSPHTEHQTSYPSSAMNGTTGHALVSSSQRSRLCLTASHTTCYSNTNLDSVYRRGRSILTTLAKRSLSGRLFFGASRSLTSVRTSRRVAVSGPHDACPGRPVERRGGGRPSALQSHAGGQSPLRRRVSAGRAAATAPGRDEARQARRHATINTAGFPSPPRHTPAKDTNTKLLP